MRIMLEYIGKYQPKGFVEVDSKQAPLLVAGKEYRYKNDRTTNIRGSKGISVSDEPDSKKTKRS